MSNSTIAIEQPDANRIIYRQLDRIVDLSALKPETSLSNAIKVPIQCVTMRMPIEKDTSSVKEEKNETAEADSSNTEEKPAVKVRSS